MITRQDDPLTIEVQQALEVKKENWEAWKLWDRTWKWCDNCSSTHKAFIPIFWGQLNESIVSIQLYCKLFPF